MKIPLTNRFGKVLAWALIDERDANRVNWHPWRKSGRYAVAFINGRLTSLHGLILGKKRGYEIDHINRNPLDNRRSNLRFVTHRENMRNNNALGVSRIGARWRAYFVRDGKQYHVGCFDSKLDAHTARQRAVAAHDAKI